MTNILNITPTVPTGAGPLAYELSNPYITSAYNLGDTATHEVGHVRTATPTR